MSLDTRWVQRPRRCASSVKQCRCLPPPDDDRYLAPQDVEQRDHLIERFRRVGGIKQAIELGKRGPEATGNLAPAEAAWLDAISGLDRELVEEQLAHVVRFLVVLQHGVEMNRALRSGREHVRASLASSLSG